MKRILLMLFALLALTAPAWALKDLDLSTNATDSSFVSLDATKCSTVTTWADTIKSRDSMFVKPGNGKPLVITRPVIVRDDTTITGNMGVTDSSKANYVGPFSGTTVKHFGARDTIPIVVSDTTKAKSVLTNHIGIRVGAVAETLDAPLSTMQCYETFMSYVDFSNGSGVTPTSGAIKDSLYYTNSAAATKDTIFTQFALKTPSLILGSNSVIDSIVFCVKTTATTDTFKFITLRLDSMLCTHIDSVTVTGTAGYQNVKVNSQTITQTANPMLFKWYSYCKTASTDIKYFYIRIKSHLQ